MLPLKVFRVKDKSMEPALKEGAYLLVMRSLSCFSEGDIIVMRHPRKEMRLVKRISRADGHRYFVIGDNEALSEDSRTFGYISSKDILGKVALVL